MNSISNYQIKCLKIGELEKALKLVWSMFQKIEELDYKEKNISELKNIISWKEFFYKIAYGEIKLIGCLHEGEIIGVIGIREMKHICMFFVDGEYHRRGIGRKLFQTAVEVCIANTQELREITVDVLPYAKEVYYHLGFEDADQEQIIKGIRFISMKYRIR